MTRGSPSTTPTPLLLAGPTAVGKSALALALAEQLGGEIVSVDSMQVYRGMDIGTDKPAAAARARVPHHLIDIIDLTQTYDAAQFCLQARQAVQDIQARGRLPILCGGTGLYFQAFLTGVGHGPAADPAVRAELEATPLAKLLEELEQRDPTIFLTIDRRNPRRIVRALEVIRLTGRPFSAQRTSWAEAPATPLFVLTRPAGLLRQRIEHRVDAMFAAGLVDETKDLLDKGLAQNQTARQALGYRQTMEYLQNHRSLAETIALVKIRTWQYARRQLTWFRKRPGARWIHLQDSELANIQTVLEQLPGNL